MMMSGFLCRLVVIVGIGFCTMQNGFCQSDSIVLTYKEYLENILNYHPVAKKADLKLQFAEAENLAARGNLDPLITSDWNQKSFDDKLYYRQYQAKLRLPTVLGVDVVGGYENSEGIFVNPENSTDEFGLWNLGIEVNILQGLFVNERKTALEQAKVFQELAKNEQRIIQNELVYKASLAYLIWQKYDGLKLILEENRTIADTYFENTKQSFFNGEKTAMDTLEAFVLSQEALALQQNNELMLIKSRQNVENFLWFNESAVSLQTTTIPESYDTEYFSNAAEMDVNNLTNHPIISATLNKLAYVEIEQRLKREKLKPKLKLKYNPLLATSDNNVSPSFSVNDYKWGFDFSMPLLFRNSRAEVQKGKLKIRELELDIQNKRNELQNKIEGSWQQQILLEEQKSLVSQNVEGYQRLLDGENEKFNFGESSVFLLNKRQEKYINGRFKLIEIYFKQNIELLNFSYYSNQLLDN